MAAKLGHKVCVVDSKAMVGGVCVNTGTIPSKTLREAVLYLTGMQLRDLYGASYRVKEDITISDLLARLQHVIGRETEVIRSQLMRNHIELIAGAASFLDPHTLSIDIEGSGSHRTLTSGARCWNREAATRPSGRKSVFDVPRNPIQDIWWSTPPRPFGPRPQGRDLSGCAGGLSPPGRRNTGLASAGLVDLALAASSSRKRSGPVRTARSPPSA
jgi:hypothetical protein